MRVPFPEPTTPVSTRAEVLLDYFRSRLVSQVEAQPGGELHSSRLPEELVAALRAQAERTRAVVKSHDLADIGQPGDRWEGADPPALERVLFHLVQEHARHAGHLDIVSELAAGLTGE